MNIEKLLSNRRYLFWTLQLVGWGGWGITWYASYGEVPGTYHIYIFVISVLGMVISLGMRRIYRASWDAAPIRRAIIILASSGNLGQPAALYL